jgi:putrescine aminotransferase
MACNPEEVIKYTEKALVFSANLDLSPQDREWITRETLSGFQNNVESDFFCTNKNHICLNEAAVEWKTIDNCFIDIQGRRYLDCLGVYNANNVGHLHPRIINAVKNQLGQQAVYSHKLLPPLQAMLARIIAMITPGKLQYSFFCESSEDAVDGAIELARRINNKRLIIKTGNNGRNVSIQPELQNEQKKGHRSYSSSFTIIEVPLGDLNILRKAFSNCNDTGQTPGAFILEPICYEEGIIVPSQEYINEVYDLCVKNEALFIVDETKTGLARTGKLFAIEHYNVEPDILCLGNTLGGGILPMGAFVTTAASFEKRRKYSTAYAKAYLGTPLSCAAAITTIQVIFNEGLVEKAAEKGAYLLPYLEKMVRKYPNLKEVRGKGLLIGLEFDDEKTALSMAENLFNDGLLKKAINVAHRAYPEHKTGRN